MSTSTAPPLFNLKRTARIVPLTRPQIVTFCAMTLPSTCAPSLISKIGAAHVSTPVPLDSLIPSPSCQQNIDMSEPTHEAVPPYVAAPALAQPRLRGRT